MKKTFLTKNAVDLDDFCIERIDLNLLHALQKEFKLDASNQVVIMVARLIKQKGVLEFADAALQLSKTMPDIRFFLIAPEDRLIHLWFLLR